jgi:peptidyl-prolyl cis-trans isomerase SurA
MKLRPFLMILSVFTAAGVASACKPTAAPQQAVSSDTWALVNTHAISRQDVEKAYRRQQDPAQTLSEEDALSAKLTILNDLVTQEILVAKATQLKLDVPVSDVDAAYAEAKKGIADDAFQQELTRRNMTAAEVRDSLRAELLARKVLAQEVSAKVAVTDQEIVDFFNANRAQFNVPEESYHLAQLVVTPVREAQQTNRRGDDASSPEAAAAKIQAMMERLKSGAPFAELAADYSEDPESSGRGGDLGLVPVSRLMQAPKPLRDAVIGKAPGAVSVVSQNGAHTLVAVISHEQAGQRDPSNQSVHEQISQLLRSRREQLLRSAYLTAARNDAQVVNYLAKRLVDSGGKPPALGLATPGTK